MKTIAEGADEVCKALADLFEVSGLRPLIIKCLDFTTVTITNIETWFKKNK
jgi:hypothetical protein